MRRKAKMLRQLHRAGGSKIPAMAAKPIKAVEISRIKGRKPAQRRGQLQEETLVIKILPIFRSLS